MSANMLPLKAIRVRGGTSPIWYEVVPHIIPNDTEVHPYDCEVNLDLVSLIAKEYLDKVKWIKTKKKRSLLFWMWKTTYIPVETSLYVTAYYTGAETVYELINEVERR